MCSLEKLHLKIIIIIIIMNCDEHYGPHRRGRALLVNDGAMTGNFGGWNSSKKDVGAGRR